MEYRNDNDAPPRRSSIPPISIPQATNIPEQISSGTSAQALSKITLSPHARTIDQISTEGSILFRDDDRGLSAANDTKRLLHFNYEESQRKAGLRFAPFVEKRLADAKLMIGDALVREEAHKLGEYEQAIQDLEDALTKSGLRFLISQTEGRTDLSRDFADILYRLFEIHGFNLKDMVDGHVVWAKIGLVEEEKPVTNENLLQKYMEGFEEYTYAREFDAAEESGAVKEKQLPKKALQRLIHSLQHSDAYGTACEIRTSLRVLEQSMEVPLTFLEFDHLKCAGLRTAGKSITKQSLILTIAAVNRLLLYKNHIFVLRRILESTHPSRSDHQE